MPRVANGTLPTVRSGVLTFPHARDGDEKYETDARPVDVGSAAWWAWLERDTSTRFCFEAGLLRFTARRRRRNGTWCWYAFPRDVKDRHHEIVLGVNAALTLERLERAAQTLDHVGVAEVAGASAGAAPVNAARASRTWNEGRDRSSALPTVTAATQHSPGADPAVAREADTPNPSLQPVPLLATKLFIPHPRPDLVPRPRLLARLETALSGPVTVLAAPAGSGKTSLLSVCFAATAAVGAEARDPGKGSTRLVAWVSLDAGDNDPIRFWTYVVTALNSACVGVGELALAQLRSPQPPHIELALTLVLNDLVAQQADVILVLDDYHVIEAESVHAAITFLLNHLPPRCHLVLSSREDPPLPLSRLRTQGAVTELRAADLRFTPEETAAFLTDTLGVAVPLTREAIRALDARSEGWIAGLQLAALSLRGQSHEQAEVSIAAFAGSNRYIVDYLVEEVLARQPPEVQSFLLRTSVVDRFCTPLCSELLADPEDGEIPRDGAQEHSPPPAVGPGATSGRRGDTAGIVADTAEAAGVARVVVAASPAIHALLEQVERANLFLIPLDDERQWYRYHHLFAEVLRARLRQQEPTRAAALHQRASAWFEAQGLVVEAIQQALAAPDVTRAAALIEQHGMGFGMAGQVETVLGWIRALPEALVRTRPQLCACHAGMLFLSGQNEEELAARRRDLEAAVAAHRQAGANEAELRPLLGILATTQLVTEILPGDLGHSVPLARDALELLPETEAPWRLAALIILQQAFEVTGDVTRASIGEWSRRAATLRARGQLDIAVSIAVTLGMDLAHQQRLRGQLRTAAASYQTTMALVPEPLQLEDFRAGAGCAFGLAHVQLEWNDLGGADQLLTRGMRMLERRIIAARTTTQGYVTLARLQQARGEAAAALATLDAFAALAEQHHFAPVWPARAAAVRAQLHLAQGDLAAAMRWAESSGLSPDDPELEFLREREYLTLVRVRIAQGQGRGDAAGPSLGAALHLLDRLQQDAEPKERLSSVLEVLILRALALHVRRDVRGALGSLTRALTVAAPEGYVRLFADEGSPMAALLSELLEAAGRQRLAMPEAIRDYAQFLRAACQFADCGTPVPMPPRSLTAEGSARETQHPPPGVPPLLDPLTERELEVLRLLEDGASNAAIAAALVVAVGTVKKHVYNVCSKLDVQSRMQAVARARALHLL